MTSRVVRFLIAVLPLTPGLAACAGSHPGKAGPAAATPIADTTVGLVKGSVRDVPTPPAVTPNDTAPGDQPVLPRPYVSAPPRIPHGVGAFLPITREDNACLTCHQVTEKRPGEPTPIPASHYTDYRNEPGRVGTEVVGTRHLCVACHVPRTGAPDLVENQFRP